MFQRMLEIGQGGSGGKDKGKGLYINVTYPDEYKSGEIIFCDTSAEIIRFPFDSSSNTMDVFIDEETIPTLPSYILIKNTIDSKEYAIKSAVYGWYISDMTTGYVPLVPKLTANNSRVLGTPPDWKVFDRDDSTFAATSQNTNSYFGYIFTSETIVKKVRIKPNIDGGRSRMKDYKIQASNDNTTWTDIISATAEDNNNEIIHDISGINAYSMWRLYVINSYNTGYIRVNELQFYGY